MILHLEREAKQNLITLDFHSGQGGMGKTVTTHQGDREQCSTPKIKPFFVKPVYLLPPMEYHTHFFYRALGSLAFQERPHGKIHLRNYKKPSYLY